MSIDNDLPDELKAHLNLPVPELDPDFRARLIFQTGIARGNQNASPTDRSSALWKTSTLAMSILSVLLAVGWMNSERQDFVATNRVESPEHAKERSNWIVENLLLQSTDVVEPRTRTLTPVAPLVESVLSQTTKSAISTTDNDQTAEPTINVLTPRLNSRFLETI